MAKRKPQVSEETRIDIDINALARLARIELTASEKTAYTQDLQSILSYFSELDELKSAHQDATAIPKDALRNVLREDGMSYEPGTFTDDILGNAPSTEDGYLVVKKIIEK